MCRSRVPGSGEDSIEIWQAISPGSRDSAGQPLAVVRDPLIDLTLIGQRRPVRLRLQHHRQMAHVRVAEDRERPAVRVLLSRQLRGGEQTGELVASRTESGLTVRSGRCARA